MLLLGVIRVIVSSIRKRVSVIVDYHMMVCYNVEFVQLSLQCALVTYMNKIILCVITLYKILQCSLSDRATKQMRS